MTNNSAQTVWTLLTKANANAVSGNLWNGNTSKRNQANVVFDGINNLGDII